MTNFTKIVCNARLPNKPVSHKKVMKHKPSHRHGFLFLLIVLWLNVAAITLGSSICLAWSGKVVEKGTGRPIKDVVIVRQWTMETVTPAGSISCTYKIKETLTDEHGKFSIFRASPFYLPVTVVIGKTKQGIPVPFPLPQGTYEEKPIVYKPGYRAEIIDQLNSTIMLTPVPTTVSDRSRELDRLDDYYGIDRHETTILKKISYLEHEFLDTCKDIVKEAERPGKRYIEDNRYLIKQPVNKTQMVGLHRGASGYGKGAVLIARRVQSPPPVTLESLLSELETASKEVSDTIASLRTGTALLKLRQFNDPRAVSLTREFLTHPSYAIRLVAISSLADTWQETRLEDYLPALGDDNHGVRRAAAKALVKIGEPAIAPLHQLLETGSKQEKIEAMSILGQIGDESALKPLTYVLYNNKDLRRGARNGLAHFQSKRAAEILVQAMASIEQYNEYRDFAMSLRYIGTESVPVIIENLGHENHHIRESLVWALGEIDDSRVLDPLHNKLEDQHAKVRTSAAFALSKIKDPRSPSHLFAHLNDDSRDVRESVARALIAIGEPSVDVLLQGLKADNSYIRWRSAWCLRKLFRFRGVSALIAALNDEVAEVRWMALSALARKGDKGLASMRNLLNDNDPGIRQHAALMIEELHKYVKPLPE